MQHIKKLVPAIFMVAALGASTMSMAQVDPNAKPGTGPNPFSDCGIGAALFPETAWAAVTSNIIWDIGTTAVTSATLSPGTCSGKALKTALFIRDTYPQLVEEVARGEGEHLKTAMTLFECGASQQQAAVQETRAGLADVVSQKGHGAKSNLEKASEMYDVMQGAAQAHCRV